MNDGRGYEMLMAADIGNSETKMYIEDRFLTQPSVVKRVNRVPEIADTNLAQSIARIEEDLLIHVTSDAIKKNGTYFVGNRASKINDMVENINIKLGNKYRHDIPVIVCLGMIAGNEVKTYYESNEELPKVLEIEGNLSTAIPASEHTNERAEHLQKRLEGKTHTVILYVADQMVTVMVTFHEVNVTTEGVPALYALLTAKDDILKHYDDQYDSKMKPKDMADQNILHADIGDGTTEYIYTEEKNAVLDLCDGARHGVGHATQEAIKLLKNEVGGHLSLNRQQFMNVYQDDTNNLHEVAVQSMDEARYLQAQLILEDIQERAMNTAGRVDKIMVYGGGSIQFYDDLFEDLLDYANEAKIEVIWVPDEYAVNMNINGLKVLNEKLLYNK
ncbi:ParM/StbA family protein [Salicibibacter cibi]|uniref:ParM/StbA family protein n=2 Tax=Salicibibacter cibi TaxID=2743001 RepID=A0A7T6ZEF7_9BACI|nr:ParM/StbA family protein [Salicibibacter cibi]